MELLLSESGMMMASPWPPPAGEIARSEPYCQFLAVWLRARSDFSPQRGKMQDRCASAKYWQMRTDQGVISPSRGGQGEAQQQQIL